MMSKTVVLHLMLIVFGAFLCMDFGGQSKLANGTQWSANQDTLPEEATLFSTRLPLKVRYLGDQDTFMRWEAPAHCSAANSSDVETEISCSTAGLHRVRLQYVHDGQIINDSRVMIMKNTPLCYRWYVLVETGVENTDDIVVKVWIWDPLLSSLEEMKQTAIKPSKFSERLTKIFAGKGQVPGLLEVIPDPRFQLDCSNMTFLPSHSMWEFYVRVSRCKAHRVQVSGKPSVASHGCFIRDTKAVISSMCIDEILQSEGSLTLKGQLGVSIVIKDPCNQDTAFLIMSGQCVFTTDGFKSTDHIMVSPELLMGASVNVRDIAITSDSIIYQLEEGYLLIQDRSSGTFMRLTEFQVNAIEGRPACHHSQMRKIENAMFLGWDNEYIYIWYEAELLQSIQVSKEEVSSLQYPFWLSEDIMEASHSS
ncbi:cation channel sperm-associated protein subunit epsilon [Strongylocentrotus purpuratus]|uniref:Uncharacterized protein n=1 Tax=Strongylocentrotus purpuratus TaxID=7668 RepID=A0A7M7PTJ1_STRPU|nr:cation channel sperm-associated protein subunit epsilon [Strongylocentrotus purpuratus]